LTWQRASEGVLAVVVIAAAVCDLRRGKIYNALTYPAILIGLAFGALGGWAAARGWSGAWDGLANHLGGFGFGFGVLFVAYILGGMGGGDVKLTGAVGAFLGWPGALYALFYSFILGAAIGVILVVGRGRTRLFLRRMGAALRLLPMPGVTIQEAIPQTAAQVPFGLAVCLGTFWHVLEKELGGTLWDVLAGLV
jgi:prepilin peptidase CpaA